jgi:1-acyl-sn-glycerol-3-phosphate acyltransferase
MNMWKKFRHRLVFALFRPLFRIYLGLAFGYRYEKYRLNKGPHLILFNHPTNFDPFMVSMSFTGPIYFMATDDVFTIRFISKIIQYLVAPIPKSKSVRDIQAVKDSIRIVKEGGTISLSPEGNRTYSGKLNHIDPAIVKLAKFLKIPVVLYTISGGFGVSPRFSTYRRRGRTFGKVCKVLSADTVAQMTDQELYLEIVSTLSVDDTKLNEKYRSPHLAEQLESLFYRCPICGSYSTLESHGSHVRCRKCSFDCEYTEDLRLKSNHPDFHFNYLYEWYEDQERAASEIALREEKDIFSDDGVMLKRLIKNKRKQLILKGTIRMDQNGIILENGTERRNFPFTEIVTMAVVGHNRIIINMEREIYQVKSDKKFNALKYMHAFYVLKNRERGQQNGFLGI